MMTSGDIYHNGVCTRSKKSYVNHNVLFRFDNENASL